MRTIRGRFLAFGLMAFLGAAAVQAEPAGSPASTSSAARPLRGVVVAVRQAALSSDLLTPIMRIGFREGERFQAGALLVEFDCERQRHDLAALDAMVREAAVAVASNEHLTRNGAANNNDVAVARARHDKARAELGAMSYRLQSCRIMAPYPGVVTDLDINPHEIPTPNKPFMKIASDGELEIEIIAPSRLLDVLSSDGRIRFTIDDTRKSYRANVRRNNGVVDAVSQTLKVYAGFEEVDASVLPGMSGVATPERAVE